MPDTMITADRLRDYAAAILRAAGSAQAEADLVADHLVGANLRGHDSHGIGLIPIYVRNLKNGALRANQHARLVQDSGAIAVWDGNMGFGQVIASEACADAIERSGEHGVALFALRNTHHVGRVGAYGAQAVAGGRVFIAFVNVITPNARAAPFGGKTGRYGTNPICIAFPATREEGPVLLDFATTGVAAGKIRVAYNSGKPLPPGMLIDGEGNPTTNAADFFEGAGCMLSFGAHKASGLALACELLAGALSGSGAIQQSRLGKPAIQNGMFAIVIDPARFGALDAIRAETDAVLDWVKSASPTPDTDAVKVAGDPEFHTMGNRNAEGIPVDSGTWKELNEAAASVGVGPPTG
jgi:hydroxycarboxylate dehydrogenase B